MSFTTFLNGTVADADEVNNNFNNVLKSQMTNLVRQLVDRSVDFSGDGYEWGEAYIDSDGRKNSVDTYKTSAYYNSTDDSYEVNEELDGKYYVKITCDSYTLATFNTTYCNSIYISDTEFYVYGDDSDYEVSRAKLLNTFYIGSGTSILVTGATNISSIETVDSADEGMNGHYFYDRINSGRYEASINTLIKTLTFANTTDNTVSSWSNLQSNNYDSSTVKNNTWWQVPGATTLNSTVGHSDASNEYYLDTSGDEKTNPATAIMKIITDPTNYSEDRYIYAYAMVFCKGTVSTVQNNTNVNVSYYTHDEYSYTTPAMTLLSDSIVSIVTHDLPSGLKLASSAYLTPLFDNWEEGCDVQYKIESSADNTGWLDYNELNSFTQFTSVPTLLTVKLIPKTVSPTTGYPSIKGVGLRLE